MTGASARPQPPPWSVELTFECDGAHAWTADAVLTAGLDHLRGHGQARKNPSDPDVPVIGVELAAARALDDLARQLADLAAERSAASDTLFLLETF